MSKLIRSHHQVNDAVITQITCNLQDILGGVMFKRFVSLLALSAMVIASGCASHITVTQKPSQSASIGIVKFTDCIQMGSNDCAGSGEKISQIYSEVFSAPVVDSTKSKDFDVIITGTVTIYNEAIPMAFNPNLAGVDIAAKDKNGVVLAFQKDGGSANNVTGSAKRIAKGMAEDFKEALGR